MTNTTPTDRNNFHIVFWVKNSVLYWRTSNSWSNSKPLHGNDTMSAINAIAAEFRKRWPQLTWELI